MTGDHPQESDSSSVQPGVVSSSQDALDVRIDRVLNKYVHVWIWSVLFGTATGSAFTFANFRPLGRYRAAEFLMGALVGVGGLFTLISIYQLYRFLVRILLPMFVHGQSGELSAHGVRLLSQAVKAVLLAFASALMFVLVQYVFGGLGN